MMKEDNHIFQGMRRDNHPIKQDGKFLWDAHNIRLTARDNNTLMSITAERSTKDLNISINGTYLGHGVVGHYAVIFTKDTNVPNNQDYIYRLNLDTLGLDTLFNGDINFNLEHPIEAIGYYEGTDIQKVYWNDGYNQPRLINAARNVHNDPLAFDFIQELKLEETVTVVKSQSGSGVFSPGTVQYAFTYLFKYGQESNIFYTTELLYTSYEDRGGSPEDNISNSFDITINNPDTRFDFIRIYSIIRTTKDSIPTVKLVTDIQLSKDTTMVTFTDTGTTGSNEDPDRLLYLGGDTITAQTICNKDNTLFLGNIEIKRDAISKLELTIDKLGGTYNIPNLIETFKEIQLTGDTKSYYKYSNQLNASLNTSGFKSGEKYRFGVQFQHKTGKWSEPLWVEDKYITNRPTLKGSCLSIPILSLTLSDNDKNTLKVNGYKKARALMVPKFEHDREIVAQGVLCPTVYNIGSRKRKAPFAQSSWYIRPNVPESIDNDNSIDKGAYVEFNHGSSLKYGKDRGAELQNSTTAGDYPTNTVIRDDSKDSFFYVDQNIVTLHSPDIEFDDANFYSIDNKELKFRLIGITNITSSTGDINIQTSSPTIGEGKSLGFIHKPVTITDDKEAGRSIVSGLYYNDFIVDDAGDDQPDTLYAYKGPFSFMVYPWQRTGSLNNDIVRSTGTRTAVLKKKIISNLKYMETQWFNNFQAWNIDTKLDSPFNTVVPSIFNSNEISLIKLKVPKYSTNNSITYYGNIDTLITSYNEYPSAIFSDSKTQGTQFYTKSNALKTTKDYSEIGDTSTKLKETNDPVRIKYKSSSHAVFSLPYNESHLPIILPSLHNIGKVEDANLYRPFWEEGDSIVVPTGMTTDEFYIAISEERRIRSLADDEIDLPIVNTPVESVILADLIAVPYNDKYHKLTVKQGSVVGARLIDVGKIYYTEGRTWFSMEISTGNYQIWKLIEIPGNQNNFEYVLEPLDTTSINSIPPQVDISSYITKPTYSFLYIGELYREVKNQFGGDTEEAIQNNMWIPAGRAVSIDNPILFEFGDTWYQRYDFIKTYPFTTEDENQIVEIGSFMCESRVNIDGRYDRNRGQLNNLNMSPINFNLLNNVYSQLDNYFAYRVLDSDFYRHNKYPHQITWTLQKNPFEKVDTWTNVTLANVMDLDGSKKQITAITAFNDNLICFQEGAVNRLLFNSRVQIAASDGVPIEIANSNKVEGSVYISDTVGCQDKWSICNTPEALYFLDKNSSAIYMFTDKLQDLTTTTGLSFWAKDKRNTDTWNLSSNGIRFFYDPLYRDVYFTPGNNDEALCFSEQLGQFSSFYNYGGSIMIPYDGNLYSIYKGKLYKNFEGDGYGMIYGNPEKCSLSFISNDIPSNSKIFDTVEYRGDFYTDDSIDHYYPFSDIYVENEYQKGHIEFKKSPGSIKKKFRVWRILIPRHGNTMNRMVNPWLKITLEHKTDTELKHGFVLHDLTVKYTI